MIVIYAEAICLIILSIHLPIKPDPSFQKPDTTYHWERGEDEWDVDGCYIDLCEGDNS